MCRFIWTFFKCRGRGEILGERKREKTFCWRWEMWAGRSPGSCVKWILLQGVKGSLSRLCSTTEEEEKDEEEEDTDSVLWIFISLKSVILFFFLQFRVSTAPVVAQVSVHERFFAHRSPVNHGLAVLLCSHDSLNQFYRKANHGYTGYS